MLKGRSCGTWAVSRRVVILGLSSCFARSCLRLRHCLVCSPRCGSRCVSAARTTTNCTWREEVQDRCLLHLLYCNLFPEAGVRRWPAEPDCLSFEMAASIHGGNKS